MMRPLPILALALLAACDGGAGADGPVADGAADLTPETPIETAEPATEAPSPDQASNAVAPEPGDESEPPPVEPAQYRFVGRWATDTRGCESRAWAFTASRLETPAGSVCTFSKVTEVPGGYDIAARCTAESPPAEDKLELRFAESARALLFESDVIADAGLVRCS